MNSISQRETPGFGSRRIFYINFAEHLLNTYGPNLIHPGLPGGWQPRDWQGVFGMVAGFGATVFEFWLVPSWFSTEFLRTPAAEAITAELNEMIAAAHSAGLQVEMIAGLATSGPLWHTLCPNIPSEWSEIQFLWQEWARRLPGLDIVGVFPGDPGACSRNGCTAETYIDRSIDIAHQVRNVLPRAEVEFNTWGPPFFGWGNLQGPPDWKGEFLQDWQHTAWNFDAPRAERSMRHLVRRLPDFPERTSISLNMGFNSDGNPAGDQDARAWVREIARSRPVYSWDFSLTEGENNVIPHYRFQRLYDRRKEERACGGYSGGICFTMTPLLSQLSLFQSLHSFQDPDADFDELSRSFYQNLFGPHGSEIPAYLPLFEVIKDWGNYLEINLPRSLYHQKMLALAELIDGLRPINRGDFPFYPDPEVYRQDMLFFARLFADLSAPHPDYPALAARYWQRVYPIWDHLPVHVDPRPRFAVDRLIDFFRTFE
jgi:hypothetical protein